MGLHGQWHCRSLLGIWRAIHRGDRAGSWRRWWWLLLVLLLLLPLVLLVFT